MSKLNIKYINLLVGVFLVSAMLAASDLPSNQKQANEINTLDELAYSFTHGLEVDYQKINDRQAFDFYRRIFFGDPATDLKAGTEEILANEYKKESPPKYKIPLRNYIVEITDMKYPVSLGLEKYIRLQTSAAGERNKILFNVGQHAKMWKKILGYEEEKEAYSKKLDRRNIPVEQRVASQEKAQISRQAFYHWLDTKISLEERQYIASEGNLLRERARKLFCFLRDRRKEMAKEKKDLRPISLALVDIVHNIGYWNTEIREDLVSYCGKIRVEALGRLLVERELFAAFLFFEGHFEQVLNEFDIPFPSGASVKNGMENSIQLFEAELKKNARPTGAVIKKTVRPLSLSESPYRSCIGGSDCSSRTYLTRALDPNYIYFGLTDSDFRTSGHVTVVLGTAYSVQEGFKKVAFVDKIQNVSNFELKAVLAAVKASVGEQGYLLALPDDLGDSNGISNEIITRRGVAENISLDVSQPLTNFKPHPHDFVFDSAYSRAFDMLPCHPIMAETSTDFKISVGKIHLPWIAKDIDLPPILADIVNSKNGDIDEKARYLHTMRSFRYTDFFDPDYFHILESWLKNSSLAFNFRKQVFFVLFDFRLSIGTLLEPFELSEQLDIVNQVLNTPRLSTRIMRFSSFVPFLMSLPDKHRKPIATRIFKNDPIFMEILHFSKDVTLLQYLFDAAQFPHGQSAHRFLKEVRGNDLLRTFALDTFFSVNQELFKEIFAKNDFTDEMRVFLIEYLQDRPNIFTNNYPLLVEFKNFSADINVFQGVIKKVIEGSFYGHRLLLFEVKNKLILREFVLSNYFSNSELLRNILNNANISEDLLGWLISNIPPDEQPFLNNYPLLLEFLNVFSDASTVKSHLKKIMTPKDKDILAAGFLIEVRNNRTLRDFVIEKLPENQRKTLKNLFNLDCSDENLVCILEKIWEYGSFNFSNAPSRALLICQDNPSLMKELFKKFEDQDLDLVQQILKDRHLSDDEKLQALYLLKNKEGVVPLAPVLVAIKDSVEIKKWLLKERFSEHQNDIDTLLDLRLEQSDLIITGIYLIMGAITYLQWEDKNIASLLLALKDHQALQNKLIDINFKKHHEIVKLAVADTQISSAILELIVRDFWGDHQPYLDMVLCSAKNTHSFKHSLVNNYYAADVGVLLNELLGFADGLNAAEFKKALYLITGTGDIEISDLITLHSSHPDLHKVLKSIVERESPDNHDLVFSVLNEKLNDKPKILAIKFLFFQDADGWDKKQVNNLLFMFRKSSHLTAFIELIKKRFPEDATDSWQAMLDKYEAML